MSEGAPRSRAGEAPGFWERLKRWTGAPPGNDGEFGYGALRAAIGKHERTLIENVLALRDLTAVDVMVPRVDIVGVDIETPFAEIVELLIAESHSRLPVYRDDLDHIVGMIHVKDILKSVAEDETPDVERLLRKVMFAAPTARALDLLSQMRQQRVHMAFVVDEFGGIDGLITIEDLVEEIVGEIEDEHDEAEEVRIVACPDGSLLVDARAPVEELEEILKTSLLTPDMAEEVDTAGGLVFMLAGRVPQRGEIIPHPSGLLIDVLDADQRRVRRLRVRPARLAAKTDDSTPSPASPPPP